MKMQDADHKLPAPCTCLNCGHLLEEVTGVDTDGNERAPGPGDYTVCIKCGKLFMFDEDIALKPIPISQCPDYLKKVVYTVQAAVREVHKKAE
jgi:transcription elongation factor Elf1